MLRRITYYKKEGKEGLRWTIITDILDTFEDSVFLKEKREGECSVNFFFFFFFFFFYDFVYNFVMFF